MNPIKKFMIHEVEPILFVVFGDDYYPIVLIENESNGRLSYSRPKAITAGEAGTLKEIESYQFFLILALGAYKGAGRYKDILGVAEEKERS